MARGIAEQLTRTLVPQVGGTDQVMDFLTSLQTNRNNQAINQQQQTINQQTQTANQQKQQIRQMEMAQAEASTIAGEANAFLQSKNAIQLKASMLNRAREVAKDPERFPGINPEDLIDMANRLDGPNGFQTIQRELQEDMLRAQDLSSAIKQRTGVGIEALVQSSKIMDDNTIVMVMKDGSTRVLDPEGRIVTGAKAAAAIKAANQEGIRIQSERAGGRAAATTAIKTSKEAFDQLAPAYKSIALMDEAIEAIDQGAETGFIAERLPSFRRASQELDNVQKRMGLNVIQNTTFGSLSEEELKFALSSTLPLGLEGPALKDWLNKKKAAQNKLIEYIESAAIFLGRPGNTIPDFLERQKGLGAAQETQATVPSAGDASQLTVPGSGQQKDLSKLTMEQLLQLQQQGPK